MLNSACVVIASILLIIPGFLSDVLAVLLLISPLRRLIGGVIIARAASTGTFSYTATGTGGHRMNAGFNYDSDPRSGSQSGVIDGDFRDVTPQDPVPGQTGTSGDGDGTMPRIEDSRWASPGRNDSTTRD